MEAKPWRHISPCRRVGNHEGEANTAIIASAAARLDEAFNFARSKVLSLVVGAPHIPIVGPIARAAGLVLHQFIILSEVHSRKAFQGGAFGASSASFGHKKAVIESRGLIDLFKNLQVNLKAADPAAVIRVLFICIVAVGVFGHGEIAGRAMTVLTMAVGAVAVIFSMRTKISIVPLRRFGGH